MVKKIEIAIIGPGSAGNKKLVNFPDELVSSVDSSHQIYIQKLSINSTKATQTFTHHKFILYSLDIYDGLFCAFRIHQMLIHIPLFGGLSMH